MEERVPERGSLDGERWASISSKLKAAQCATDSGVGRSGGRGRHESDLGGPTCQAKSLDYPEDNRCQEGKD